MKLEHVLASKGGGVYTIGPDAHISEALSQLAAHNVGALVVVEDGLRPIGILSERDIVRATARGTDLGATHVADLMTGPPVTGTPSDDIDSVLRTMTDRRFRHLPVVSDGLLIGVVTLGDLVKYQLSQYRGTVETLEARLMESQGR